MSLWPFLPVDEVIEVLEWRTDVLRARAGEQRHRLRERPRRTWNLNHIFDEEQQSAARAIVRGAASFQVPDWISHIYAGPVSAGSHVSIALDTAGLGLAAGGSAVLFHSLTDYETCTIESVSPAALVLEFVTHARNVMIYRADEAHAAVTLSISRQPGLLQRAEITFEAPAVDVPAATFYAQYRGHDVLPVAPMVISGSLAEGLTWPVEKFDNTTGVIVTESLRDLPEDTFTLRWHVFTVQEIQSLREWISSRCGRWLAFWHSTGQRDLVVAADISAGATTLRVFAPQGVAALGRSAFDLEIEGPAATWLRRVTAVSAGPAVNGRPTFDLTIDSALGTAVAAAAFGRVCFLRCARFNADRVELLHRPGEGLAVSVPCIEVPVP